MSNEQKIINIEKEALLARAAEFHDAGYRLVQIGCTALEDFEVNYSFDRDYELVNLRLILPRDSAEVQSISGIYWSSFIYENEIHDLFGIDVKNMAVDYKGGFYRTAVKYPFSCDKKKPEGDQT